MKVARTIRQLGIAAVAASFASATAAQDSANVRLPSNPRPGECYQQIYVPPPTREVARRELLQEASTELVVTPARYEWVDEEVKIEEEAEIIEVTPARFEIEKREVVIEPERREVSVEPAEYEIVSEPVQVRAAYSTWRRCDANERLEDDASQVMCFVTVPAEYRTVERRVVSKPAQLVTRIIPAKTVQIDVKVMVERPRRRIRRIPAVTRTFRVLREIDPMRTDRTRIPATYQTVFETVKAGEGRLEWRPILCETSIDIDTIRDVQRALSARGFEPGPIDGVMGPLTRSALAAFQRSEGLAQGGLEAQTLLALGIENPG